MGRGEPQGFPESAVLRTKRKIVAQVPFVDVVTTMLDESIPLTAGEWEEYDPTSPVRGAGVPRLVVAAPLQALFQVGLILEFCYP